ncbi:hypothetical protein CFOL_v3_23393 [Cephalotus follicularis]|uniref:Uncharacterized protein n=1 Tax=Cephalotus follicularis TaxID=3775 RepID=A0A1Q3CIP3_CEPFO|nr:hypothetical protein CFOL_v3_23393 [Cephalotus follicularis]
MATEEFSFPVIANDHPCCVNSPPLWHASPNASHEDDDRESEQRRSRSRCGGENDDEEKMDKLWEDFTIGELSRNCGSGLDSRKSSGDMVPASSSKTNDAMISPRRRPSVAVFFKVLKKLFLLRNYHPAVRKRGW